MDDALTFGPEPVPLSVLDLAPVPDGGNAGEALRATTDLARHAERLGFRRFWVAEHHNMPGIASSAPPVLIGHIADATTTMRVGSGGVMLPNHVSLVVAEQFGMLEALHPGRIDLGIGRAPGTDQVTAAALRRSPEALSADDFPDQLMDLLGFFTGRWPEGHPFARITAVPGRGHQPAMWLLGSSGYSAQVAGAARPPVRFRAPLQPGQHAPGAGPVPLALPPVRGARPALRHGRRRGHLRRYRRAGPLAGRAGGAVVPAPAHGPARPAALAGGSGRLPVHELEREFVQDRQATQIIGAPETVRRGLAELLTATAADELMLTTMVFDPADRLRSFELVAALARTPSTEGLPTS